MLNLIEKLINEHGSSTILKERLELINDKYELLESKLQNSEKENELLRNEVSTLKQQLSKKKQDSEFVEYKGSKFKKLPSGDFENTVYCGQCNNGMFSLDECLPYSCAVCNNMSSFTSGDLYKVLREIKINFS